MQSGVELRAQYLASLNAIEPGGATNGELAEIKSGVHEGDRVVTAGKVAIRDGTEIQVIDAAGKTHDSKALVAGAVSK